MDEIKFFRRAATPTLAEIVEWTGAKPAGGVDLGAVHHRCRAAGSGASGRPGLSRQSRNMSTARRHAGDRLSRRRALCRPRAAGRRGFGRARALSRLRHRHGAALPRRRAAGLAVRQPRRFARRQCPSAGAARSRCHCRSRRGHRTARRNRLGRRHRPQCGDRPARCASAAERGRRGRDRLQRLDRRPGHHSSRRPDRPGRISASP